jgi:cytochrome c-type biogenesis protein CcmH/NrfF
MKTMDPEILCRGHYGAIMGKETVRYHLQRSRQSIEEFKAFVLEWINRGDSVEEITKEVTEKYSKGFLQFFPPEDNYRLWGLLVQRTLEHFGIEIEMRD